jgi:hypothetical protein
MVEMHYPLDEDREQFNEFYHKHITMLLSIDGFMSAQRYECDHDAKAPFLAVYKHRDANVITSKNYTSRAGRDSVDPVFKSKMSNWDRNMVDGDITDMNVSEDGWLVLIDRLTNNSPPLPEGFTSLKIIGLDATIAERGIKIVENGEPEALAAQEKWSVRRFRPIHPTRYPG